MSDYDVPPWKCQERGCPVIFTSTTHRLRRCLMHTDSNQALSEQRREYLDECADLITRPPTEVRSKGRVVRG